MSTEVDLCPKCGKGKTGHTKFGTCTCELSMEQRRLISAEREKLKALLIQESESFEKEHPDLKLEWSFSLNGVAGEA